MAKQDKQWLRHREKDVYRKQAKAQGLRSRSAFKLMEIQEKTKLCLPGMSVVELGAAPGGWSGLIAQWIGPQGKLIAVDCLVSEPIPGVVNLTLDIEAPTFMSDLRAEIKQEQCDLVVSDLCPNKTGIAIVDQLQSDGLYERVLSFLPELLKVDGSLLIKVFHGVGYESLLQRLRSEFKQVKVLKPDASRKQSSEIYVYAKHYSVL